jgi:hypothetical protein
MPNGPIGRPRNDEGNAANFRYINLVAGDDVLSVLRSQREEALALFSSVTEEKSLHRYAPGKWSIREVLNHINDTERTFAFRAFWFARGFKHPLPDFDQDVAAPAAEADRVSWAAHTEEFDRVRLSTISLFENMPPAGWLRKGIASDSAITVRALAYLIAGHLAHHMNVLRNQYLQR